MEIKNVLERMLAAERAADETVAEAEKKASEIVASARKAAVETTGRARDEAQHEYIRAIKDACDKAHAEKKRQLDQFRKKFESSVREIPDERRRQAVDLITRTIAMLE